MNRRPLAVYGYGMVSPVGFTGPTTCAAMRAGVSGIQTANLWDFTVGERLSAGRAHLPQWWEGPGMLPELLAPAVVECLSAAPATDRRGISIDIEDIPVVTILSPRHRPDRAPGLEQIVHLGLTHKLGRVLPPGSEVIDGGRTGIARALDIADRLLEETSVLVVVAGVESFLRQNLVEHYIPAGRLLCGTNSNGFILGEAACAVLVGRPQAFAQAQLVISGVGRGHEPSGAGGDEDTPVTGDGLTTAIREALQEAGVQCHEIDTIISDHNGERFKFKEAAIAAARLDRLPPSGVSTRPLGYVDQWHPVEYLGEIGAALFPCMLGWAFEAGRTGYAMGKRTLLHAGEDDGERVAIVTTFEHGGTT